MRSGVLWFTAGIAVFQLFSICPTWHWLLVVPCLIFIIRAYPRWAWVAWLLLGISWALFRANLMLANPVLPENVSGKNISLRGYVTTLPDYNNQRLRFQFHINTAMLGKKPVVIPEHIRLSWYRDFPLSVTVGRPMDLIVRLKPPRGFSNPGGFDYERWLFSHGIGATGYVKARADPGQSLLLDQHSRSQPSDPLAKSFMVSVNRLRQELRGALNTALTDSDYSGLVLALAIGDKSRISRSQWDVLRYTGTSHLVAISGLHIGLVAGLMYFLMRWLWARSTWLTCRFAAPRAAALSALGAALIYAGLAGFAIPTQRALIMVAIAMFALIWGRLLQPSQVLCFALLGVLLLDPLSVLSPGFWLSFWAVAVILFNSTGRIGRPGKARVLLGIHIWVVIGLTPLLVILFQHVSLGAPVANVVAVPWISWVTVPLVLTGTVLLLLSPPLGTFVLGLAEGSLELVWYWLEWLAHLPLSQFSVGTPLWWTWLPALLGVVWLLAPRGLPARWLALPMVLPLFLTLPERPDVGGFDLSLLDVGQGLAVVVQTRNHVMVYDTGPRFSNSFDAGSAVITPFLRQFHRGTVDKLVVSHGDADHVGGALGLIKNVNVKQILAAEGQVKVLTHDICQAAASWQWDGVSFRILYPFDGQPVVTQSRDNNYSCVLKISTKKGQSVLLSGDIEAEAERLLLKFHGEELRSDVLVVPHHGSRTSSTPEFVRAVKPRYALVPAGYRNRFHFPATDVVKVYRQNGSEIFNTGETGAISFQFTGQGRVSPPTLHRSSYRRYWQSTSGGRQSLLNYGNH